MGIHDPLPPSREYFHVGVHGIILTNDEHLVSNKWQQHRSVGLTKYVGNDSDKARARNVLATM